MTVIIDRKIFTDLSTIADLSIDGDLFCRTLEPSSRKGNPTGKLAIPALEYKLTINAEITTDKEKKFGFTVIQVNDVPGRTNIEIHPGNTQADTLGCILPGNRFDTDTVYDSRNAFFSLKGEIQKQLTIGDVYLQIVGGVNL